MRRSPVKRLLLGATENVLGRRNLVRLGRALLDHARLDVPNVLAENGESELQRAALACYAGERATVIDVGANSGQWSRYLLAAADALRIDVQVHAFEPSSFTFSRLSAEISTWGRGRVVGVNAAVSDTPGRAAFHTVGPGAGANSFHPDPRWSNAGKAVDNEDVEVVVLDGYLDAVGVDNVALLKSDAEGHDLHVLRGAARWLEAGRVAVVQFEYNDRWIGAGAFLRDAFALLEPLGYEIGKLTPRGVEWYPGWDPELETFREANYVASRTSDQLALPRVRWWKTDG